MLVTPVSVIDHGRPEKAACRPRARATHLPPKRRPRRANPKSVDVDAAKNRVEPQSH
jgi:hypothetical protein